MKKSIIVASVALSVTIGLTLMQPIVSAQPWPIWYHDDYSGYLGYQGYGSWDTAIMCTHFHWPFIESPFDTWTGLGLVAGYSTPPLGQPCPPYKYIYMDLSCRRALGGSTQYAVGNMDVHWYFDEDHYEYHEMGEFYWIEGENGIWGWCHDWETSGLMYYTDAIWCYVGSWFGSFVGIPGSGLWYMESYVQLTACADRT